LGCFAAQAALDLGDLHAFARARACEIGFELGDHGQDVEEQPPDGPWGRARSRPVQADLAAGEVVDDVARVGQRARRST
jgi:hypothetical protein